MVGLGADDAVSPIIGTLTLLAIVATVSAVILALTIPRVLEWKASADAKAALSAVKELNNRMDDLALQSSARSDQVDLTIPAGNLALRPMRSRFVVHWSSDAGARYNYTLGGLDNLNASYRITTHGLNGSSRAGTWINHTTWVDGQRRKRNSVQTTLPETGDSRWITVRDRDGNDLPLDRTTLHIRFTNSSGTLLGEAWVLDTGAVRYEGDLYGGPRRYELLYGAVLQKRSDADPRVQFFDPVRVRTGSPDQVTFTVLTTEVPDGVPRVQGSGQVFVPIRSHDPLSLGSGTAAGNVTVDVLIEWGDPDLRRADLLRRSIRQLPRFVTHGDRLYIPGTIDVFGSHHAIVFPEGLQVV